MASPQRQSFCLSSLFLRRSPEREPIEVHGILCRKSGSTEPAVIRLTLQEVATSLAS